MVSRALVQSYEATKRTRGDQLLVQADDDIVLVEKARSGDSEAFGELVRRWSPAILAVCEARVHRREVAEDLAHDALLRAWKSLDSLEHPAAFGAWLRGIAIRRSLDWLKSKARTHMSATEWLGADGCFESDEHLAVAGDEVGMSEEAGQLMSALDRLSDKLRETLFLFYLDEMSYAQIAELSGISVAAVNARLTKARREVREILERS